MLSDAEKDDLYLVAASVTGTCQDGRFRHDVIVSNVEQRMHVQGIRSLREYMIYIRSDPVEKAEFVSAVTIHTTSWFRELPHFQRLEASLRKDLEINPRVQMKFLSAACSTGQEVYSIALLLESLRAEFVGFEYEVVGVDIDAKSLGIARRAIYTAAEIESIPERLRRYLWVGSGPTSGKFTLTKEIRNRCTFQRVALQSISQSSAARYHRVFCRNVLIYFSTEQVDRIIRSLLNLLDPNGALILGHSEVIDAAKYDLQSLGNTTYIPLNSAQKINREGAERTVLIIDDCQITRLLLTKQLNSGGYQCINAASANEASEILKKRSVDLITLDLGMPGIDGPTWLRAQRALGMMIPVLIVSGASREDARSVLGALDGGAQDYVDKRSINSQELVPRVSTLIKTFRRPRRQSSQGKDRISSRPLNFRPHVILIGASTGGTQAISHLLRNMPAGTPPIVVTQHISSDFAAPFAERLSRISGLSWKSPIDGEPLVEGGLYLASGDYHIGLKLGAQGYFLSISDSPPINRHRPSVDYLFRSAVSLGSGKVAAFLLTGMGNDGAQGLLELKERGAWTFCQNEDSCVVFGMPREAIELGAATAIGDIDAARQELDRVLHSGRSVGLSL